MSGCLDSFIRPIDRTYGIDCLIVPPPSQIEDDGFAEMMPWKRRVARAISALAKLKEPGCVLAVIVTRDLMASFTFIYLPTHRGP